VAARDKGSPNRDGPQEDAASQEGATGFGHSVPVSARQQVDEDEPQNVRRLGDGERILVRCRKDYSKMLVGQIGEPATSDN